MMFEFILVIIPPACGIAFGWWLFRIDQPHHVQLNAYCAKMLEEVRVMADNSPHRDGPWIDFLQH